MYKQYLERLSVKPEKEFIKEYWCANWDKLSIENQLSGLETSELLVILRGYLPKEGLILERVVVG